MIISNHDAETRTLGSFLGAAVTWQDKDAVFPAAVETAASRAMAKTLQTFRSAIATA
jgi:hypothetical protein